MNRKSLILLGLALLLPLTADSQDSKENADFKLALNLYNDRFYDLALEQFRQFVSFYPNSQQGVEARYYLGLTQFELKRYDEARLTFQNFAVSYPDHPRAAEAWEKVGESYLAEGDTRAAALAFERVRTFHPRSRLASGDLQKAASLFEQIGDEENAVRVLKILTEEYASSGTYGANLRLAELYVSRGQLDAAMTEVRKVIDGSQEPRFRGPALYLQARIMIQRNRSSEAKSVLLDLRKNYRTSPAYFDALFTLADLSLSEGVVEDAVSALRDVSGNAGASDSIRQKAYYRLGTAYESTLRSAEAFAAYDSARSFSGPLSSTAAYRAARIREIAGDTLRAARLYEIAASDTSLTEDRLYRLIGGVKAGRWLGRADLVVQNAERVGSEYAGRPEVPAVLLRWAEAELMMQDNASRAEELFSRVSRSNNAIALADRALLGQARCLSRMGYPEKALDRYGELLKRFPASALRETAAAEGEHLAIYTVRDRDAGTQQLALLLGDVIEEQSRSTLSFRLAEISFLQLKNYTLARDQYRSSLEGDLPAASRPVAWYHLGKSLQYLAEAMPRGSAARASASEDALKAFESLLREHPEHPLGQKAFAEVVRTMAATADNVRILETLATRADSLRLDAGTASHVWTFLATQAVRLGVRQRALEWFGTALKASRDDEVQGEILWRSGSLLAASGSNDTARGLLTSSLNDHGVHPFIVQAGMGLASLEARAGHPDVVRSIRERLIGSFLYAVDEDSLELLLADAEFAAGNFENALRLYTKYRSSVETDPFHPAIPATPVVYRMALAAHRSGDAQTALRLFGEVIGRNPEPSVRLESYYAIASLAERQGDLSRASAAMESAARVAESIGGDVTAVALQSADLLFRSEQYKEALDRYTGIQKQTTSDSLKTALDARIVVCYFRLDNPSEADQRATAFLRKNPRSAEEAAEFGFERGKYYVRQGQLESARKHFETVIRQYPNDSRVPESLFWLGRTYEIDQQPDSAALLLDSLLRRYPTADIVPRVELNLGNVYYTLEQWDKAATYFRKLVDDRQRAPELVRYAMNNLILTYKELTLYDGALQLTREYISLYPDDPELINKRIDIGVLYQKLGYYDQSIVHLQNLLLTAPSEYEAELRYYIGEGYYYNGDQQQAILEFLKVPYLVVKRGPIDWVATSYYMAGQSYEKLSRFDQAIAMYQQIIDRRDIDAQFKTAAQREIERVRALVGQRE